MTSIRAIVTIACVLAVSACGGVARPGSGSAGPQAPPAAAVDETSMELAQPVDGPPVANEPVPPSTITPRGSEPDFPSQAEVIDLGSVQAALDDLDDLFGAFDSQIGSIELVEGETP